MTVTSTATSATLVGNGMAVAFPFGFSVAAPSEVAVTVAGTPLTGGFSVSLSVSGGTVVFGTPPAAGASVLIESAPSFQQNTTFANQGAFLPSVFDSVHDRQAIGLLYLKDQADRSIIAPRGVDPIAHLAEVLPPSLRGSPGGYVEAIGTYAQAVTGVFNLADIYRVTISGTATEGDDGAGRQFAYNSAIDATYVTSHPGIAFLDSTGRGFLEIRPRTVVQGPTFQVMVDNGYDATQDILAARVRSSYTGDDAPVINAVAAVQRAFCFNDQVGSIAAATPILLPLFGQRMVAIGSRQQIPIVRDPSHTGNTVTAGSQMAGCGSLYLENLFFQHAGRIGYGSTQPAGSLPGVLLKNNQAHIEINGGQAAKIINCGGWGAVHMIRVRNCGGLLIDGLFTFGGVWDPAYTAAQEAISIICLSSDSGTGQNTEVVIANSQLYGSSVPDRSLVVGDTTVTAPCRVGPLYGVLVNSCENWRVINTLVAGIASTGVYWAPDSANAYNANGSIIGSAIDESGHDCIGVYCGDPSYVLPNTLTVNGSTINGQFAAMNGLTVYNGPSLTPSLQTLRWTNNTARAFLASAVRLNGVSQAMISDSSFAGYNAAYSGNATQATGIYLSGTATDVDISNVRLGGGANLENDSATPNAKGISSNGCKYGVYREAGLTNIRGNRIQKGVFGQTGGALLARHNADGSYVFSVNGEVPTSPIFDAPSYLGA